jgi:hypothetical protein
MALVFERRLAIPWAAAFFAVVLTAPPTATPFLPPTTALAIAAIGIAAIVFLMPGPIPSLRTARGAGVRTLDEPNRSTTNDALDLARMDDDGGWHMARPSAFANKVASRP